jgi:hypothetical protein
MEVMDHRHQLESSLLEHQRDLRDDLLRISEKLHETREELSPRRLVQSRMAFFSGLALVLGFILGLRSLRSANSHERSV